MDFNNNNTNDIFLREIALLMEEIDTLKGRIREQEKTIEKHAFLNRKEKNEQQRRSSC